MPVASPTSTVQNISPIRKIDFKNFQYAGPKEYSETFLLKAGEKPFVFGKEDGIFLKGIEYHDLTSDGQEEAIIVMNILTGGFATPSLVFIYGLDHGKPVPLWKFLTGDRADGGLKKVTGESGNLTVELYGENKLSRGKWVTNDKTTPTPDCCPIIFTRFVLRWDRKRFALVSADILPVP